MPTEKDYAKLFNLAIRLALHDEVKEHDNPAEATIEVLEEADKFFGPEVTNEQ